MFLKLEQELGNEKNTFGIEKICSELKHHIPNWNIIYKLKKCFPKRKRAFQIQKIYYDKKILSKLKKIFQIQKKFHFKFKKLYFKLKLCDNLKDKYSKFKKHIINSKNT